MARRSSPRSTASLVYVDRWLVVDGHFSSCAGEACYGQRLQAPAADSAYDLVS
jgi:hypothetical protein